MASSDSDGPKKDPDLTEPSAPPAAEEGSADKDGEGGDERKAADEKSAGEGHDQDAEADDAEADDAEADDAEADDAEADDAEADDEEPSDPAPAPRQKPAARSASGGRRPKKKATKKRRRLEEPEEYEPVFSGRLVAATAICLAMVFVPLSPLGRIIAKESPQSQAREAWRVGTEGNVHITVITADFDKLNCADERELEGMHCAYKDEKEPFPVSADTAYDDNKKHILQPYRTTDGQLLFMAGLWTQPEIAMRLHNEPARGVTEKNLARFVADCRVKFLEEWQGTKFRWAARGQWSSGETGMVAKPVSCHIFQEEEE